MVVLKKIENYCLWLCIVLCAVSASFSCYDRLTTIRYFLWSLFTVVLFYSISIRGDFGAIRSPVVWFLGGYLLMVLLSGSMAVNRSEWLYESLRVFVMLVFLFITITLIDDRIYPVIASLAVGLSLFGIFRIMGGHINGLGGNRNVWAECLVLLMPFCWKYKAVVLLLLINILFTQNRASFVAVTLMLFILLDKKARYILAGTALLALIYFFIYQRDLLWSSGRIGAWKATLVMFKDYPLGVGAGNWKIIAPLYRRYFFETTAFQSLFYNKPHNDYLWVLSETGILGLGFYLGFFAYLIKKAWHNRVLLSGIIGYMVLAFFSFPMEHAIHTILLCVLAGLIVKDSFKPVYFQLWPIVLCALIFAGFVFGLRHIGNVQAREARVSNNIENIPISWFSTMDETTLPLYAFRGVRRNNLRDYIGALEDFKAAYKSAPNNPVVLDLLGRALININKKDMARPYIERALSISPDFESAKEAMKFL